MKKSILLLLFAVGLFVTSFESCKSCKDEDPRAQVSNNGTIAVSVQIKTSDGNTENINNVAPGTTSEFRSYAAGDITFTLIVDKVEYVKSVPMVNCYEYLIAIDANNNVTSTATDRND